MAVLSDTEADLAWYFCPNNHRVDLGVNVYSRERTRLSEREICLLKEQERRTLEDTDLSMKLCQSIISALQKKVDRLEQENGELHRKWDGHND